MAKAQAKYRSEQRTADLGHYDATETEYKMALASLSKMSAEHLAALQAGNDDASDHELAMQIIANRRYADEQKAADDAAVIVAEEVAADVLAADIAHRAELVTALDTHIDIVAAAMETADDDEKLALTEQLKDLKKQRDAAYVASQADRLIAAQAEIDAVGEQIKTAQGAELAALKAHQAAMIAEYGAMVEGINKKLEEIETPKIVEIITKHREEGGGGGGGGEEPEQNSEERDKAAGDLEGSWSTRKASATWGYSGRTEILRIFGWSGNRVLAKQGSIEHAKDLGAGSIREVVGMAAGGIILPRPGGQLVNVGEGREPEAILNPSQLAEVMGIGGDGGSSQPMEFLIQLGDETLATVYVEGKRVAVREGRD